MKSAEVGIGRALPVGTRIYLTDAEEVAVDYADRAEGWLLLSRSGGRSL